MLLLPLLSDFLLLDHDLVSTLLITFVPLFGFEKLILQMGHLNITLIVQLVDSSMEHNLEAVQLRDGALFLVTKLIDELSQTLIVVKVALIVAHVAIKLDLLLMSKDSSLLSLILDLLKLFFEAFIRRLASLGSRFTTLLFTVVSRSLGVLHLSKLLNDLFLATNASFKIALRHRQVDTFVLKLESFDENVDEELVIEDQIDQVCALRKLTFVVREEVHLQVVSQLLVLTSVLAFKDVNVDNFVLLAFLSLLRSFKSGLVHLFRRDVVKSLFDDLVHIEDLYVFIASKLLLELDSNGLLASKGFAKDHKLESQVTWDAASEAKLLSFVSFFDLFWLLCVLLL